MWEDAIDGQVVKDCICREEMMHLATFIPRANAMDKFRHFLACECLSYQLSLCYFTREDGRKSLHPVVLVTCIPL